MLSMKRVRVGWGGEKVLGAGPGHAQAQAQDTWVALRSLQYVGNIGQAEASNYTGI